MKKKNILERQLLKNFIVEEAHTDRPLLIKRAFPRN